MTPCQPELPASARSPQAVRLLHLSARAQFQALLQTRPLARTLHFALHGLANHQETDRSALFAPAGSRSEEHTSELQSLSDLVCRLLLEKKKHV